MFMDLPEGVSAAVQENRLTVKGPKGELSRAFDGKRVRVVVDGQKVEVAPVSKKPTRDEQALSGTIAAHLRNMAKGVTDGYEVRLQLVYSHFPVSVEIKGSDIFIKNFLGEKRPRAVKVRGAARVVVKGQDITVSGVDKEDVGQTANNLISATGVGHRDERIFQDGIYYA